jgi:1,2-diacylglycerol 3-alpha-glucosyltransferase
MAPRKPLKLLFYVNVLIVVLLLSYKIYLNLMLPDFQSEHSKQLQAIHQRLGDSDHFSFAVIGNINNSVGIFEKRIIPALNHSDIDFMISAGNAVSSGGEDKYRALQGSLNHLQRPYLLNFGENEYDDFGSYRFYEHFGPHFFDFHIADSHFIFLDSTGKTPWQWQRLWLEDLLKNDKAEHRFLFVGHPLLKPDNPPFFDNSENYLQPKAFREALLGLIKKHHIDAVFSSNLPMLDKQHIGDTRVFNTGGGGGLVMNTDTSFYHYLHVSVAPDKVSINVEEMAIGQHAAFKQLESLWLAIYSLFYVGFLNFILIVSALTVAAIKLHHLVFVDKDYYPNYDLNPEPWLNKPLRIAMFSNNYLPFIGGVPLSIQRLKDGLTALGNTVWLAVPRYPNHKPAETDVLRVPSLITMGQRAEFRLANIFLWRTVKQLRQFKPDIIHVHHPFWLGSLGLFLARRLNIPAVYTYHTRLEHYAHFVPLPGALFRNLISHALIKRFANKCDAVIVPTYSAEEYLRMIGVRVAIFVQPTGINYHAFQTERSESSQLLRDQYGIRNHSVLISVSRLSNEKNIDFMIDALAELKRKNSTPFKMLMIGDGHQRQRLQAKIDQLHLSDNIILTGPVPPEEMALHYSLGDIFVFASKSETQGMVILEAMAAGLPVVAVRSSGIDDVVQEGKNGFKTLENRHHWLQALQKLIEDPQQRQAFSEYAKTFSSQYAVNNVASNMKGIYASILAQRQQQAQKSTRPRA